MQFEHLKVTVRWAQANGEVERQNQSLLKRIRIAQAERKDWKQELETYLMASRALPHAITEQSPAELLFGRKMRTKLPDIGRPHHENLEVRDHDQEMKAKAKTLMDATRNAKHSEVELGDKVLVRQDRVTKLTTPFAETPMTVISKKGNSLVVEAETGAKYSRNTSFVKKFNQPMVTMDIDREAETQLDTQPDTLPEVTSRANDEHKPPTLQVPETRPERTHTLPTKYKEYIMS